MMLARQDLLRAWKRGEIRFEPDIFPDQIRTYLINGSAARKPQNLRLWNRRKLVIWLSFTSFNSQVRSFQRGASIYEITSSLSSIDLRLGRIFTKLKSHIHLVIRPAQDFDPSDFVKNTTLRSGDIFTLRPKEFRLGQTLERITLPANLAAHIHGRSSMARAGLAVHSTAPHIHPGFYGPITLELFNYGEWELEFIAGKDVICQLILWEVKTPPPTKLVKQLSSYRGQTVPFPSKKQKRRARSR